eukprot:TRINITY_DN8403_c0_g2_i1.p1 TRINITY_DN8403_c0_g2~~TRINITY_DN8403_c0_g2_i1.p1  ORF type:complete len:821 (-),score=214.43 TRINITY_DN8403_c0_g2_i1:110-2446(-)
MAKPQGGGFKGKYNNNNKNNNNNANGKNKQGEKRSQTSMSEGGEGSGTPFKKRRVGASPLPPQEDVFKMSKPAKRDFKRGNNKQQHQPSQPFQPQQQQSNGGEGSSSGQKPIKRQMLSQEDAFKTSSPQQFKKSKLQEQMRAFRDKKKGFRRDGSDRRKGFRRSENSLAAPYVSVPGPLKGQLLPQEDAYKQTKPKNEQGKKEKRKPLTRLEKKQMRNLQNKLDDIKRKEIHKQKMLAKGVPEDQIGKQRVHLLDASFIEQQHYSGALWIKMKIHDDLLQAIKQLFKFKRITKLQEASLEAFRSGNDVVAQTSNGAGTTFAYLIPIADALIRSFDKIDVPSGSVLVLIILPTPELVRKAWKKAEKLLRRAKKFSVLKDDVEFEFKKNSSKKNEGREKDSYDEPVFLRPSFVITDSAQAVKLMRKYPGRFENLQYLVLDDADILLETFLPDIQQIKQQVPENIQISLFSTTFSPQMKVQYEKIVKPDYHIVTCVEALETQTAPPKHYVTYAESFQGMLEVLYAVLTSPQYVELKSAVFFPYKGFATIFTKVFKTFGLDCWECTGKTHDKKNNPDRTIDDFNRAQKGILFCSNALTSNVVVDKVNLVVQFGIPNEAEFYFHRLGRTSKTGGVVCDTLLILHKNIEGWFPKRNLIPSDREKLIPYEVESKPLPAFNTPELFNEEEQKWFSERLLKALLTTFVVALKNEIKPKLIVDEVLAFLEYIQNKPAYMLEGVYKHLNPWYFPAIKEKKLKEKKKGKKQKRKKKKSNTGASAKKKKKK